MIFFISDLHLHATRPEITKRFFQFLQEEAKEAKALYILGDFFEAWVGEDAMDAHDKSVIQTLKNYAQKVPTYFMQGNRDFLCNEDLIKKMGLVFLPDPSLVKLNNKRVLLMHGDSLCTLDVSYQRFRRFVRHPIVIWLYLKLPLGIRQKIAGQLRNPGKRPVRDARIYDVTQEAVEKMGEQFYFDYLIHGHTHKPGIHEFIQHERTVKRIVLGDWGKVCTILKWNAAHPPQLTTL